MSDDDLVDREFLRPLFIQPGYASEDSICLAAPDPNGVADAPSEAFQLKCNVRRDPAEVGFLFPGRLHGRP